MTPSISPIWPQNYESPFKSRSVNRLAYLRDFLIINITEFILFYFGYFELKELTVFSKCCLQLSTNHQQQKYKDACCLIFDTFIPCLYKKIRKAVKTLQLHLLLRYDLSLKSPFVTINYYKSFVNQLIKTKAKPISILQMLFFEAVVIKIHLYTLNQQQLWRH